VVQFRQFRRFGYGADPSGDSEAYRAREQVVQRPEQDHGIARARRYVRKEDVGPWSLPLAEVMG